MPSDAVSLYWRDLPEWTEQQAAALRALAGRADLPNALDLENLIEEVESLGKSEVHTVTSLMRGMLEHLIKVQSRPASLRRRHWEAEILAFHGDLVDRLTPSMRRQIDLDAVWRRAVTTATRRAAGSPFSLPTLPTTCPIPRDAFAADDFDIDAALAKLAAAM